MRNFKLLFCSLILVLCFNMMCFASGFNQYTERKTDDDTVVYSFDNHLIIEVPDWWDENVTMKVESNGVNFYHTDSYDKYMEEDGFSGGFLFGIGASVNQSFTDLPSYQYIGFNEDDVMNYYAVFPTDYQAYPYDKKIENMYRKLYAAVEGIVDNITIEEAAPETEGISDNEMELVGTDDFNFEIPKLWHSFRDDDRFYVTPSSEEDPSFCYPMIYVEKLDENTNVWDFILGCGARFVDYYRDGIVEKPFFNVYETEDNRYYASMSGSYSAVDASVQYTQCDFVGYVGKSVYHFHAVYISNSNVDEIKVDETTYFDLLHVIDSFQLKLL